MRDPSLVGVIGPLEPFAAGFATELARLGYTPRSSQTQLGAALLRRVLSGSFIRGYARGRPLTGAFWPGTATGRHLHPLLSGPCPS